MDAPPPLRIRIKGPRGGVTTRTLVLHREWAVVGRSRSAQIRLPAAEVSGAHARITRRQAALWIEDLGSANGTLVNGVALHPGQARPLGPGDTLQIAGFQVVVDAAEAESGTPGLLVGEAGTATLAAQLVREMLSHEGAGATHARLVITGPGGDCRTALLKPGPPVRLGRDPRCAICIDDPELSREHAELTVDVACVTVRDLSSKNGVILAGRPLEGEQTLRHGDCLVLGETSLRFEDPAELMLRELDRPSPASPSETPPAESSTELRERPSEQATPPGDLAEATLSGTLNPLALTPPCAPDPGTPLPTASASRAGQLGRGLLIVMGMALMGAAAWALWRLFG